MNDTIKIRVAGNKKQVEEFTEKVREWSKRWGKRKIFRVKRYDRQKGAQNGKPWKYHPTFGARRYVNYITMKLPEDPQKKCGRQHFGGDTGIDADFQWPGVEERT